MDNSDKDNQEDSIIKFPDLEDRKARTQQKKRAEKTLSQQQKQKQHMEEYYRAQYRADRAKNMVKNAQKSVKSSKGMINWEKIPPFTRFIGGICILVQLILTLFISDVQKLYIIYHFGFVPGFFTGEIAWSWTAVFAPFTTLIIHSDWMHLAFNMVMIVAIGAFFERIYGTRRTIIFFILCGMAGNLAYFFLSPSSTAPVIGASGALSGIFAVTFMTMIEHGMLGPEVQKRGPLPFLAIWAVIILAMGFIGQNISWQSHMGGFLGGIALFHLWRKGILKI